MNAPQTNPAGSRSETCSKLPCYAPDTRSFIVSTLQNRKASTLLSVILCQTVPEWDALVLVNHWQVETFLPQHCLA